ncbi:MAG: glutathione S-transferase family protein [Pseudomonadota bacterium]|jgi:glutathione S-transferase
MLRLVIGNRNYSSWSLRPWLALAMAGAAFEVERIALYEPGSRERILAHGGSGKVPVLRDGSVTVWESLAICEYVAERFPQAGLWPLDPAVRARARAVATEMHGGFAALRREMPMNIRRIEPGRVLGDEATADLTRVLALWRQSRADHAAAGPFLFGRFSIADAMYAPVVLRLRSYCPALAEDPDARGYMAAMLALAPMQQWIADALAETERIAAFDA